MYVGMLIWLAMPRMQLFAFSSLLALASRPRRRRMPTSKRADGLSQTRTEDERLTPTTGIASAIYCCLPDLKTVSEFGSEVESKGQVVLDSSPIYCIYEEVRNARTYACRVHRFKREHAH